MKHVLKIHPQHWQRVFDGTKTFEIRVNDRAFQKGDQVVLRPYNEKTREFMTGNTGEGIVGCENYCDLNRSIGDVYPIDAERVVFSLLPAKKDWKGDIEK